MAQEPIIFDDDVAVIDVETAEVIDADRTAVGVILNRTRRPMSWLARIFFGALSALIGIMIWTWTWNFLSNLLASNPLLGRVAIGLAIASVLASLIYIMRELAALVRLRRVDQLRDRGLAIRNAGNLDAARQHARVLNQFYRRDREIDHDKFTTDIDELSDADTIIDHSERMLMAPLDARARSEIERRARQVAVVTAFVPLALVDLLAVLNANVGMIRNIAEIYGGRPGWFGGWRLLRRVVGHLVATGAVAVGDDVIGSVMGGNIVGKVSRRFGEGIVNGALTARVGIAAIEVCRPMVFQVEKAPSVRGLIGRALAGFANRS